MKAMNEIKQLSKYGKVKVRGFAQNTRNSEPVFVNGKVIPTKKGDKFRIEGMGDSLYIPYFDQLEVNLVIKE